MSEISNKLTGLEKLENKINLQKGALLQRAITSTDPNDLVKAQQILSNINVKEPPKHKSFLTDPNEWQSFMGFKQKPIALTYSVIRRMSYALPIIRAVINTRIDQITAFCKPQTNRYSTGFVIKKKKGYFSEDQSDTKPTKVEYKTMNEIAEMIMNCGGKDSWGDDDFDSFTRKVFNDSLTFDQMNFEIVSNNKGGIFEFLPIDAATIRIADDPDDDWFIQGNSLQDREMRERNTNRIIPLRREKVKGYWPKYCQIYDNIVQNDYYPWELCFGTRNPSTNIYANGYGISEIEILINTVTSMLWAEEYNRKFFSQGSAPKGFIKIKSGTGATNDKISEFKRAWQAMMSGVNNSHKTPVLEGDVDWVDLQKTNRDMEFSQWFEFLIKVVCAIYRIDPAEVNFPLSGGSEQRAMFEGNNEARLKHSKDKGLKPLVEFYQRKLNKYIISRGYPEWELNFVGLENDDPNTDIERDVKMVSSFMTVDEVRISRGLKPLGEEGGGNIIENAVWLQNKTMTQQMELQQSMGGPPGDGEQFGGGMGENMENNQEEQEDPFGKALQSYWDTIVKSN